MKFIRTFNGKYIAVKHIKTLYVDERNRACAVFCNTEIVIWKFRNADDAQKWLDDFVDELNEEAPT